MAEQNIGKVVQVIGPVLDVEFQPEKLPDIYNALHLKGTTPSGLEIDLVAEPGKFPSSGQSRCATADNPHTSSWTGRPVNMLQRTHRYLFH